MKRLAILLTAVVLLCAEGYATNPKSRTCNLIFIGNSITAGALHADKSKTAPPVFAAEMVGKMLPADVIFRNCGRSGATTVDFLPSMNRDFARVERAIAEITDMSHSPIVFSIMLGTNDSASKGPTGSPVSDEDYKRNLLSIIARLRELCPSATFVLQRPIWYSPNTYNSAIYLMAGLKRMVGYTNLLIEIANENDDVYLGDFDSFDFFRDKHRRFLFAENGNAGTFYLHPNERGAKKLAHNWAHAIVEAIKLQDKNQQQ